MQGRDRSRRRAQTTSTLSEKARTKGYALRSSSSVLADGLPAPPENVPMSVMGQKQTWTRVQSMSALCQKQTWLQSSSAR
jgi:hypothetical protein